MKSISTPVMEIEVLPSEWPNWAVYRVSVNGQIKLCISKHRDTPLTAGEMDTLMKVIWKEVVRLDNELKELKL